MDSSTTMACPPSTEGGEKLTEAAARSGSGAAVTARVPGAASSLFSSSISMMAPRSSAIAPTK